MTVDVLRPLHLPERHSVAGVLVSATTYDEVAGSVCEAALARRSAMVAATCAHGLTLAAADPEFRRTLNDFEIVTPDGQPVRWALNLLHGARLRERVYGPTLMLRVCEAAAAADIPVFLYGSRPEVVVRLAQRLRTRMPNLRIAGRRSPPFRPLTQEEDESDVEAIRASGAGIVFVALGCPRQEVWAHQHRERIGRPIVCVGAAFDFHAGTLRQAPEWMQARGLEWLFRLFMEPRRLWRRYVDYVPRFMVMLGREYVTSRMTKLGGSSQHGERRYRPG
jgi:exopolysaccharide biosynthesis WecB/TagA/CpsF family protein